MPRLVLAMAFVVGAIAFPAAAAGGMISLTIGFRADETAPVRLTTLRCAGRATGTVPRPAEACRRLQALGDAVFRPTPRDALCTEIFGGPSTARVTGIYFGRKLWVRLSRANGCEIERWARVAFLLPRPAAPR